MMVPGHTIGSPLQWSVFITVVLVLLVLDLLVFHREGREMSSREALGWCLFWIGLAIAFNLYILFNFGVDPALEFFTGYIIEYSLSVDNIFVFLVLFTYFAVPAQWQHRVLFYGILGAIVMRGVFILVGTELLQHFEWMMYLFGLILLISGIKLMRHDNEEISPERNPIIRLCKKLLPLTPGYHEQRFFVREGGKLMATPLLLVLISIELTDVVFALDSVPAIFAITLDPFIVFTSNIFAILGLRSMYILLSSSIRSLTYLKSGLSIVLIFIGIKMLIAGFVHIPTWLSLLVIIGVIGSSVVLSLLRPAATTETK